eukprot:gene10878-12133_t
MASTLRQLRKDLDKAMGRSNNRAKLDASLRLGQELMIQQQTLEALGVYTIAFSSYGKSDWDCIRGVGDALMELERYEEELEHRMQHLEIALSETNRVEIQRAYTLVGNSNRAIAVFNKETPKEQKPFFDAALAAHKKSCDIATGLQDTLMA